MLNVYLISLTRSSLYNPEYKIIFIFVESRYIQHQNKKKKTSLEYKRLFRVTLKYFTLFSGPHEHFKRGLKCAAINELFKLEIIDKLRSYIVLLNWCSRSCLKYFTSNRRFKICVEIYYMIHHTIHHTMEAHRISWTTNCSSIFDEKERKPNVSFKKKSAARFIIIIFYYDYLK